MAYREGVAGELEARPTTEVCAAAGNAGAVLVDLDGAGLALLPVTERLHRTLSIPHNDGEAVLGFLALKRFLADWAASLSSATPVAYLHQEFFGGTGFQAAVGWRGKAIRWGPRFTASSGEDDERYELATPEEMAVNGVLQWLGVDRGAAVDECEAAGLTRFRWTDEWEAAAKPARG